MPTLNPILLQVAKSTSIIQVKNILKCGFELEYNSDDQDQETDYESLSEAFCNSFDVDEFIAWTPTTRDESLIQFYNDNPSYVSKKGKAKYDTLYADYQQSWESDHESDYQTDCEKTDPEYDSDLVELGEDSSVTGGELRTNDAHSPSDFCKAVDSIEFGSEHSVGSNCSFHIHLSIKGIVHSYGRRFQAEMLGYLLLNKNGTIENRLNSTSTNYFKVQLSEDKFTAVHFHKHLKTWEFRIFGGIKDKAEQKKCLLLAYQAYRHACAYKLKLEKSVFGNLSLESIIDLLPVIKNESTDTAKKTIKKTIETTIETTVESLEIGA